MTPSQDVPPAGQYGPWLLRVIESGWPGAPVGKRRRIEDLAAKSGHGTSTIYEDIGKVHPRSPERVAAVGKALRLLGAPKCSEFIALSYAGYIAMCIAIVGTYVSEEGEMYSRAAKDRMLFKAFQDAEPDLKAGLNAIQAKFPELKVDLTSELVDRVETDFQKVKPTSRSFEQVMLPAIMGVRATLRNDDAVDFAALAPIDLFVWRWLNERPPGRAVLEARLPPRFRAAYKTAKPFQPPDDVGLRSVMEDDRDLINALKELLPFCLEDIAEVLDDVLREVPARKAAARLLIETLAKAAGISAAEAALAIREMASLDPAELKAFFENLNDGAEDPKEPE
jgi:hypothetical protein